MSKLDIVGLVINSLVVIQAFLIAGLTLASLSAYRKHSALKHIIAVSIAHVGLMWLSIYNIFTGSVPIFSWRVLIAFCFYALSDYSMIVLLKRGHYVDYYERLKGEGFIKEEGKPIEDLTGGAR